MINFAAKWTKNAIRAFTSSRNFNPYNLAKVVHITEREKRTIVGGTGKGVNSTVPKHSVPIRISVRITTGL